MKPKQEKALYFNTFGSYVFKNSINTIFINVSHAKNRVKRLFKPNLHKHKFWVESENKFVILTVSTKGMRIIDKNGIDAVLKDIRAKGIKV